MASELGTLRDIQEDELEIMLEWRNAPSVRQNMYSQTEISLADHLDWWSKMAKNPNARYFMYEYKSRPTGIVSFNDMDFKNGNSAWAFYASPSAVRGTGSRMEFLALDYFFSIKEAVMHKLYCEVLSYNQPVITMHTKFGFQTEGIFREHYRLGSELVDIHRLAILRNEWMTKRPEFEARLLRLVKSEKS